MAFSNLSSFHKSSWSAKAMYSTSVKSVFLNRWIKFEAADPNRLLEFKIWISGFVFAHVYLQKKNFCL